MCCKMPSLTALLRPQCPRPHKTPTENFTHHGLLRAFLKEVAWHMVFEACMPEFEKLYLDLLNGAIFFVFSDFFFGWGLAFFFRLRAFLVLGRFGALGPPITVLTKIRNGVISRPKKHNFPPKKRKNQSRSRAFPSSQNPKHETA